MFLIFFFLSAVRIIMVHCNSNHELIESRSVITSTTCKFIYIMSKSIKKGVTYSASGDLFSCLFCNIVAGTEPATVVAQNEKYIVFKNIRPVSKTAHYLVSPKEHIQNLTSLSGPSGAKIINEMVEV